MNRPRVLLVNPLVGDRYEFTRRNRPLPLGLLGLGAALRDEYDVRLVDQRMDVNFDRRLTDELREEPLFVGVHVMGGPQIRVAMELSRRIKAETRAPIVWGGAFPTLVPDAVARYDSVDYTMRGEGDRPVVALAAALRDGTGPEGIPALTYLRDGEVISNPEGPRPDMDDLPDPAYELVDARRYDWSGGVNRDERGLKLQMESTRGCTSRCIFCYNPFFYHKSWRALSAGRTVDRMATLVTRFGATHVDVIDDSFFEDLDRVREFSRGILDRRLGHTFLLNGGKVGPILAMTDEDLEMLREAGCRTIHLGAESGSDKVLRRMAKGITRDEIRRSNVHLKRHRISPSYYFMCGSPGETDDDLKQSVDTMLGILSDNPDAKIVAAFSFTPFAQTPGFRLAQSYGMPTPPTLEEWSHFDTLSTLQPWLDDAAKRRVRSMFFIGMFIDDKIEDMSPSPLVRLLARLYRPVARFRLRHLWLSFPVEEMLGRYALEWVQNRGERRERALRRLAVEA